MAGRAAVAGGGGRAAAWAGLACLAAACAPADPATLTLTPVDTDTGAPTPARIEVLDETGAAHVASDALPVVQECAVAPLPEWAAWLVRSDRIEDPHTGRVHFYADGRARLALPPGRYRVRAFKGMEYEVTSREVELSPGDEVALRLPLARWIAPRRSGWVGADDHLHITRLTPQDDRRVGRWMQAEGLDVANLLQMGTAAQFGVTPQHRFGAAGSHREGTTLLLSGQEHPRTHFLGHTITLGARERIDLREAYVLYQRAWRESRRLGGVSGYAHWGLGPARDGLAIDAPGGWLDFVEVLQFEFPHYDVWYQLLDLGIRLAPTAGTDFPCGPSSLPGRERFYTRVDGRLDRQSWLDGVRRGRTFVTNGPILELRVEGAGIGEEIEIEAPGPVRVEGVVRFDPLRDRVRRVELVRNGSALAVPVEEVAPGWLRLATEVEVREAAWIALRTDGDKLGEAPLEPLGLPRWAEWLGGRIAAGASFGRRERFASQRASRPSAAHTAPVYVAVVGMPPLGRQPRSAALAARWMARLDELEARLADDRIGEIPIWDWVPYSDGVSEEHLRRHRDELRAAIAEARAFYRTRR